MRVSEPHAHARKSFHLRRAQLHIVHVAGEILLRARVAHPHVIRHEEDDVGLAGRVRRQRGHEQGCEETCHGR